MHVLYLQTNSTVDASAFCSSLLGMRSYDAMYRDECGKTVELSRCLSSLQSGDTLYIDRESVLSTTLLGAVKCLSELARHGVNVWSGRKSRLIESSTSPYLSLTEDTVDALCQFRNDFTRFRQGKGIRKAKRAGQILGRKRKPLPPEFDQASRQWLNGQITLVEAAGLCGMSMSRFWKRAREKEAGQ